LALKSYLLFDLETGKPLPLGRIIGKDAGGKTYPLNVPDCFRNGTPILDCSVNYFWSDGDRIDDAESRRRLRQSAEVHERVRKHLMGKKPGSRYSSYLDLEIPKHLKDEITLKWFPFLTDSYQISPNLPQGYGYTLQGPEGDDPEPEKADRRTDPKKSGVPPPWNQPR
jgi:hypothetical protein